MTEKEIIALPKVSVMLDEKSIEGYEICRRVSNDELPKGYYKYGVRSSDGYGCDTLEPCVAVNHIEDIITREKLDFPDGFLLIKEIRYI